MSRSKTYSADEISRLLQSNKAFELMARRCSEKSYEEFVDLLYEDIDQIFAQMSRSSNLMRDDSEDRITSELVSNLRSRSYTASHDKMAGGHVDVDVELEDYCWLGEAKFDDGPGYIEQGFLQLTTRYSNGSPKSDCGGLLIYIRKANALRVMNGWREAVQKCTYATDVATSDCALNPLAFRSVHTHSTTGLPYKVRHIPLLLYFNPQDKSGQKSQAGRRRKSKATP